MELSIVTINYNNEIGLSRTIQSVINQSCHFFEFIIIDGGSTDESIEVINRYAEYIDYWVSEKDAGIYDAMNKGIAKASGDYVMFLNSGDSLAHDGVINICLKEIENKQDADIFYGNILVANHQDPTYDKHIYPNEVDVRFFKNDTLNHQASLINNKLFAEFGYYPTNYKLASDYWLFLRSCINQKNFYHINKSLVIYDFSGVSSQDNYLNYREEKAIIWNSLVPAIIDKLVSDNEQLTIELRETKRILSYKIVAAASRVNYFYQRLKNKTIF